MSTEKKYPIRCELCSVIFDKYVSHSHLRAAHGMTTAEYRGRGFKLSNPAFYRDRSPSISGSKHYNWKGGRYLAKSGYVYLWRDGRLILEHRDVMEKVLGRRLHHHEQVHHRDGDKANNEPENLVVMDRSAHTLHHLQENWADGGALREKSPGGPVSLICTRCSSKFTSTVSYVRMRRERYGQDHFFCSRKCSNTFNATLASV